MTPIHHLYTNVVFPIFEANRFSGLPSRLERLKSIERQSLETNRKQQWEALKRLCQHAYDTTPFYRAQFDAHGLHPDQIKSPADLQRIPVLTRDEIRLNFADLWSRSFKESELSKSATGGTTDTPVAFYRDQESVLEKNAVQQRLNAWAGYLPGDKTFFLWGAQSDYPQDPSWRWRFYDRYVMRRHWAATSLFNEESLSSHLNAWNELRPDVVFAYPTPLTLFCQYLDSSGAQFHLPRSVICTAEPLLDEQRETIRKVLGVDPFEHYGSREVGMVAAQCAQKTGMHVDSTAVFIEHLPVDNGESGLREMVITDLLNYGMPLIRYQSNDCSLLTDEVCDCGIGFPLIKRVMGRTTDNFYLPNGDVVPGISFQNRIIKVCPGIKKIQVIQESIAQFRIRYVPTEAYTSADLQILDAKLREFLGQAVSWEFQRVDDIERERSGKTRFCISHVKKPAMVAGALSR
jgi:phenylacetate-CoA ligase